ncbi:MAG: hypothetical protein VKQ33_13210 [Candidatus Sericytochromatia bacterium]|nr:hypothetical protein [Candidatus Sericytochromatia bacterium]
MRTSRQPAAKARGAGREVCLRHLLGLRPGLSFHGILDGHQRQPALVVGVRPGLGDQALSP